MIKSTITPVCSCGKTLVIKIKSIDVLQARVVELERQVEALERKLARATPSASSPDGFFRGFFQGNTDDRDY